MNATDYSTASINSTGQKAERIRAGSTTVTAGSSVYRADGWKSTDDYFKDVVINSNDTSSQSINATNYS